MKFHNLKKLYKSDIIADISNIGTFTYNQQQSLIEYFRDLEIYSKENELLQDSNIFLRLSMPFLFIILGLILLSMPVKWLLTGKHKYSPNSILLKFVYNWMSKFKFFN